MVKHLSIDLDDEIHKELSKFKGEKGLTWNGILLDWMRRVKNEAED